MEDRYARLSANRTAYLRIYPPHGDTEIEYWIALTDTGFQWRKEWQGDGPEEVSGYGGSVISWRRESQWVHYTCSDDLRRMLALLLVDLIPTPVLADAIEEEIPDAAELAAFLRRWATLRRYK